MREARAARAARIEDLIAMAGLRPPKTANDPAAPQVRLRTAARPPLPAGLAVRVGDVRGRIRKRRFDAASAHRAEGP